MDAKNEYKSFLYIKEEETDWQTDWHQRTAQTAGPRMYTLFEWTGTFGMKRFDDFQYKTIQYY